MSINFFEFKKQRTTTTVKGDVVTNYVITLPFSNILYVFSTETFNEDGSVKETKSSVSLIDSEESEVSFETPEQYKDFMESYTNWLHLRSEKGM